MTTREDAPMRMAVHNGETVVNVVLVDPDSEYDPGDGLVLATVPDDSCVSAGWVVHPDGTFTEPTTGPDAGQQPMPTREEFDALLARVAALDGGEATSEASEPTP